MIVRLTALIFLATGVIIFLVLITPQDAKEVIGVGPLPQDERVSAHEEPLFLAGEEEASEEAYEEAEAEEEGEEHQEAAIDLTLHTYIEVIDSCGPGFESECVVVRSSPSTSSAAVTNLRNGVVLKVSERIENEGRYWYKIEFDEWIRYPNRVAEQWYVAADFVREFKDPGVIEPAEGERPETNKKIVVVRGEQMLYAYEGDELFMQEPVSTGLNITPTPRGTFTVYKKTPTRYMQGPLPGISDKYYDLPGVSWNLYFTYEGAIIHGTYWHEEFGKQWSNGCVNLPTHKAEELYHWADVGTQVVVRD